MAKQNYEQTGIAGRLKEYGVLYLFIFLAAVLSLVVMNLIIFPVAVSAVHQPKLFSAVVKYGLLIAIAAAVLAKIVTTVRRWCTSRKGVLSEIAASLSRRGSSFLFGLIVLLSGALLAVIIYLLLTNNYRLLYEIMN